MNWVYPKQPSAKWSRTIYSEKMSDVPTISLHWYVIVVLNSYKWSPLNQTAYAWKETKKTISPEHVIEALKNLGYADYINEVEDAYGAHKIEAARQSKNARKNKDTGMTEQELIEEQRKLFAQSRARTGSTPNTPSAVNIQRQQMALQQAQVQQQQTQHQQHPQLPQQSPLQQQQQQQQSSAHLSQPPHMQQQQQQQQPISVLPKAVPIPTAVGGGSGEKTPLPMRPIPSASGGVGGGPTPLPFAPSAATGGPTALPPRLSMGGTPTSGVSLPMVSTPKLPQPSSSLFPLPSPNSKLPSAFPVLPSPTPQFNPQQMTPQQQQPYAPASTNQMEDDEDEDEEFEEEDE